VSWSIVHLHMFVRLKKRGSGNHARLAPGYDNHVKPTPRVAPNMVASPRLGLAPNMVVRPKVLGSGNPCQTQVNNKQIEDNCAL
jgi:hypothetical protein